MAATKHVFELGTDCLLSVLNYIDDFRSFYSFSLTCKQFRELAKSPTSWHLNVVKRKARFYAAQFVIKELPSAIFALNPNVVITVKEILRWANICDVMKPTIENVLKVWESRGPVAAQFFLWVREFETMNDILDYKCNESDFWMLKHVGILYPNDDEINVACLLYDAEDDVLTIRRNLIPLPDSSSDDDDDDDNDDDDEDDDDYDDDDDEPEDRKKYIQNFRIYLQNWDGQKAPEPLQEMVDYIQKVIGPTSSPITGKFLLNCLFLREELLEICPDMDVTFKEEEKIYFKDASKNVKPIDDATDDALIYWDESYDDDEGKRQSMMSVVESSFNIKELRKVARFLPSSEQNDNFSFFSNINDLLQDISENTFIKLLLRTDFSYDVAQSKKNNENIVRGRFLSLNGEDAILKLKIVVSGVEIEASVVINIPGRKDAINVNGNAAIPLGPIASNFLPWFLLPEVNQNQASIKKLQPFTNLVKKCLGGGVSSHDIALSNCALWRFLCMYAFKEISSAPGEFFYRIPCPCFFSYNRPLENDR